MNKQTELNLRFSIAGVITALFLLIVIGLPVYLLGALIGWTFEVSQWHWVLRGILGVAFVGFYLSNAVNGLKYLKDRKAQVWSIMNTNPKLTVKEAVDKYKKISKGK